LFGSGKTLVTFKELWVYSFVVVMVNL